MQFHRKGRRRFSQCPEGNFKLRTLPNQSPHQSSNCSIQGRTVKRQTAIWEHTLRHPNRKRPLSSLAAVITTTSIPTPLRRLTLCYNKLGDEGLHWIMEMLVEEIGILGILVFRLSWGRKNSCSPAIAFYASAGFSI